MPRRKGHGCSIKLSGTSRKVIFELIWRWPPAYAGQCYHACVGNDNAHTQRCATLA